MPSVNGYEQEQMMQLEHERQRSAQLHMFLLSHAARCNGGRCPSPNCARMKDLLRHEQECTVKSIGGCMSCKRIWALVHIHARQCQNHDSCHIPHCREVSSRYHRIQQAKKQKANEASANVEVVKV